MVNDGQQEGTQMNNPLNPDNGCRRSYRRTRRKNKKKKTDTRLQTTTAR
jgi:hypothetical protein